MSRGWLYLHTPRTGRAECTKLSPKRTLLDYRRVISDDILTSLVTGDL